MCDKSWKMISQHVVIKKVAEILELMYRKGRV